MTVVIAFSRCPVCFQGGARVEVLPSAIAVNCPRCGLYTVEPSLTGLLAHAFETEDGRRALAQLSEALRQASHPPHVTKPRWDGLLVDLRNESETTVDPTTDGFE